MPSDKAFAVDDRVYQRVFQEDADGQAILSELAARHIYKTPFVAGDHDATLKNIGKQELILEIMGRSGQ